MKLDKTKRWAIRSSVLAAVAVGGAFAACKAEGPPRPTCNDIVDGGDPDAVWIDAYTNLTTDAQPTTVYGMDPDPGPQCTDCTQASDLDVMLVSDFEDGFAPAWFNYGEPGVLIEPPQAGEGIAPDGGSTGVNPPQPWWGLQVATLANVPGGERCGSRFALHMEGGRFAAWGGGYVTRHFITRGKYMERFCETPRPPSEPEKNGIGTPPQLMTQPDNDGGTMNTGCMFWASPVDGQPSLLGVDVSDFDGISFWARRGPSGQSSLRIALIDDNTSEDLALFNERNTYFADKPLSEAHSKCERIKGCCRHCYDELYHQEWVEPNRLPEFPEGGARPATDDRCWLDGERLPHIEQRADGMWVAWDFRDTGCGDEPQYPPDFVPDAGLSCWAAGVTEVKAIYDSWNTDHSRCCPRTMAEEKADPYVRDGDPLWGGKDCRPYVFQYDYHSGNYCHSEGDVLPEANQNRCGEGFESSVVIDTEWKLFTIPWEEMRRFTPDKPPYNPKSVWQIAIYFGQGYLDTYIDDIGFYRKRR